MVAPTRKGELNAGRAHRPGIDLVPWNTSIDDAPIPNFQCPLM